MVTAFTATVLPATGFALACQLDKGLSPEVDYMALRRDEERGPDRRHARPQGGSRVRLCEPDRVPVRGRRRGRAGAAGVRATRGEWLAGGKVLWKNYRRRAPAIAQPQCRGLYPRQLLV